MTTTTNNANITSNNAIINAHAATPATATMGATTCNAAAIAHILTIANRRRHICTANND